MSWTSREWLESLSPEVRQDTLRHVESLRRRHSVRFWNVLRVLSEVDPEGLIDLSAPPDEYEQEDLIIPRRLPVTKSVEYVQQIVADVLMDQFEAIPAESQLVELAVRLWNERQSE